MEVPRQAGDARNNDDDDNREREQHVGSSAGSHAIIALLISTLTALLQMKYQTADSSLFHSHKTGMVSFVISMVIYTMSLAGQILMMQSQHSTTTYHNILGEISLFSGALASILLVTILLPILGWLLLTLWAIFFVRAVSSSCTELFYRALLNVLLLLMKHSSRFHQQPQRLPL